MKATVAWPRLEPLEYSEDASPPDGCGGSRGCVCTGKEEKLWFWEADAEQSPVIRAVGVGPGTFCVTTAIIAHDENGEL